MPAVKNFDCFNDKEDIYELMDRFGKSLLNELEISFISPTDGELNIKMAKAPDGKTHAATHTASQSYNPAETSEDAKIITAPLVGTFYASPSPDSEPYVKIGDKITYGAVLCIIEAMKSMNEIESETEGEITEVLAKNGMPVEYGQPLFKLK